MKHFTIVFITLLMLHSCKEEAKLDTSSQDIEVKEETSKPSEQTKETINDLGKVLAKDSDAKPITVSIDKSAIEKLYKLSGIPKEEYQEKLNHPDTLKRLIKQVEINNKKRRPKSKFPLKGAITLEQLTSKNTTTGVSIEEAMLVLQDELKRDLTAEKIQKVDAMSGTTIVSTLTEKDVKYLVRYVGIYENYRLRVLSNISNNLHSKKEATAFLGELEGLLKNYEEGTLKASPKYPSKIALSIKIVKSTIKKMVKKEQVAQEDFKKLNPDLYFGEDVGETFFSSRVRAAVYLPLGKLSFADTVINAYHPDLNVLSLSNVIGTPDVIEDNGAMTITGEYSIGEAGTLTVQFSDNALTDVNGPDLYIFEIGKVEPTNLEISKDGITWIKVGKIDGGVSEVDIAEFVQPGDLFYYVRLTDLKQRSALPGADVDAIAAIGAAMRLKLDSKVLFETGKSELKLEGIKALKELAASISVLKKGNVIVEGHTDDVGDASFNKKLSLARSKSVIVALKKLIPGGEFKWLEKGLGESKPIVENDSDENRSKNRRVEILVVPN